MTADSGTRAQIMDAFGDQLAATGYPGVSLVGVARTAGIQKPSIYHHFPGGKQDLYVAVAERYIDTLHRRVQAALDTEGALDGRLDALARACGEHARSNVSFEQRIYDALDHVGDPAREHISRLYVSRVLDPVVGMFSDAVDAGELVSDPQFLTNAFLHLVRATDMAPESDGAGRLVALFLDGARPRAHL